MFHIYEGFHLVETYHKMRHQRKYNPDTKRAVKIAIVAVVTLLLCFCHADVDSRNRELLGHVDCHYGADVAILYG